jgi:hypothetical protein
MPATKFCRYGVGERTEVANQHYNPPDVFIRQKTAPRRHCGVPYSMLHEPKHFGLRICGSTKLFLLKNLIFLMIVEVVHRGLLASSACVRPYNNDAEFPSCRASRPSCNAGRDHRVATSTDRAPTKSNSRRPMLTRKDRCLWVWPSQLRSKQPPRLSGGRRTKEFVGVCPTCFSGIVRWK